MIALVAQTLNWCVSGIVRLLATAALVGQLIVSAVAGVLTVTWSVCEFIADVYEDNRSLFVLELPAMVLDVPVAVWAHIAEAAEAIGAAIGVCADSVSWNIGYTISCLKNLTILLGDSMWLIITFVPVELPALVGAGCARAYSSLLAAADVLGAVPLEATVGLVACVVSVRIAVECRAALWSCMLAVYWWLRRRIALCFYMVYHYWMDDDTRAVQRLATDDAGAVAVRGGAEEAGDEAGDVLCVVCQERHKCVLTLPCRHICLCCECCVTLYNYQRTCPICRTFICHSVNVYL